VRSRSGRVAATLAAVTVLLAALAPSAAGARCRCPKERKPRCGGAEAKYRVTVAIDLVVEAGTVEVLTQSGPYRVPVADLDGKTALFLFLPRGDVFQGFLEEVIPGSIAAGPMQGASARISTGPVFPPGEYELLLFIDAAAGSGSGAVGPQRGDLAVFDNTVCDPTGVSVRVAVGCEDTTVSLTNRHFIIF
jgi:hypothetical protein